MLMDSYWFKRNIIFEGQSRMRNISVSFHFVIHACYYIQAKATPFFPLNGWMLFSVIYCCKVTLRRSKKKIFYSRPFCNIVAKLAKSIIMAIINMKFKCFTHMSKCFVAKLREIYFFIVFTLANLVDVIIIPITLF